MKSGIGRYAAAIVALCFALGGCASGGPTKRETGAVGGAALGALAGAIIGHQTGNKAAGAAIGGALGGVGGAVVGDQLEAKDQQLEQADRRLDEQQQELARNRALIDELKKKNLDVRETRRGVVVNLPDILFEFDRATLTSAAGSRVRDIADVVSRPGVRERSIAVEGHTDSVGSEDYNQRLSERRAESVATALVDRGVSRGRIRSRGLGERYPIAPNTVDGRDDPAGRAKNRRVEVIIEN